VYNIKIGLGVRDWGAVDWIGLAQNKDKRRTFVNVIMKIQIPEYAWTLSSGYTIGGLSSTFSAIESVSESYYTSDLRDRDITHIRRLKKNSWPLARKRTIPTERPPFLANFSANFCRQRAIAWSRGGNPTAVNLSFLDRSCYFSFK
jgi:hypothetical protein